MAYSMETIKQSLQKMMKEKGPIQTIEHVKEKMAQWKTQPVKFALIGSSAVGKSTYINTVRRVKRDMPGWAEVGPGDTTEDVAEYTHPDNKQIVFCDIPGYGMRWKKRNILEKIEPIDQFDYFLILFNTTLSELDESMAETITAAGKPFCLVRTMIDSDIRESWEMKCSKDKDSTEEREKDQDKVIGVIRQRVKRSVEGTILESASLFLISCKDTILGEFNDLWDHMKQHLPRAKYEAIMLTLPILTKSDIDRKHDELKKRIPYVATVAGVISAIPIPFLDIPVNMYVLQREVKYYIEVLRLNREEVKDVPGRNFDFSTISVGQFVRSGFRSMLSLTVVEAASQLDVAIPVIGSAISFGVTSSQIDSFLHKTLNDLRAEAVHIFNYLCQRDLLNN